MKYVILLVSAALLYMAHASSDANPNVVFMCNARNPLLGCDLWAMSNGVPNRKNCLNSSRIMSWVDSPKRSDCYKLFIGDEATPSTTYVPGELTKVSIRVMCNDMLFRGMLLYAVNSSEVKVGDWDLTTESPPVFTQPWKQTITAISPQCANSVMHYGAGYKSYLNVIRFIAPPAGTGPITFRCLIKYGDANVGSFYWPNLAGDITLAEGRAPTETNYQLTDIGQSCGEYCSAQNQYCDPNALSALQSASAMDKQVGPHYLCNYPILSGCGNDVISYDNDTQYCYYADPTCAAQKRTPAVSLCNAKAADVQKFCVCSLTVPPTLTSNSQATPSSGVVKTPDVMSSGYSLKASGLLNALFIVPFLFLFNARHAALYLTLIFGIMGTANGHNWINSRSRSPGASGVAPCKPALSDLPHAQVGPGQTFSIEWMTAHGSVAYFVVLHSKDTVSMAKDSPTILEDYIKMAPNGSDFSKAPQWQRYHRMDKMSLDNNLTGIVDNMGNVVNFYNGFVNPGDAGYIPRPSAFGGRVGSVGNPNANNTWQVSYKPADRANDIRVSYYNAKYPWIESVTRFALTSLQAVRPDAANFVIPGRGGPGRYIVHWLWSGYRDCVDVDYKTTTVLDVYGFPSNATNYKRIDHCMMKYHFGALPFFTQVVTDMTACLKTCDQFGTGCYGVNLVPTKAPKGVYPNFKISPFQKFGAYLVPQVYGADFYAQWNETIFLPYTDQIFNATYNRYVCYGVVPLSIALGTEEEFTTTADTEDPLYYSTCYYKLNGNMFSDYIGKQNAAAVVPWRANGKCIDCASKTLYTDPNQIPTWKTADICVDCDREPSPAPVLPSLDPVLVEVNTSCDGVPSNVFTRPAHSNCSKINATLTCVKKLDLLRSRTMAVSLQECKYLASADPECGTQFSYMKTGSCYCYKKLACCNSCSRIPNAAYDTYEITSKADPNCATGRLSADRTACCSGTCGNCTVNAVPQDMIGFCNAGSITRPCTQFAPPCKM